jgi:hypothetical protein
MPAKSLIFVKQLFDKKYRKKHRNTGNMFQNACKKFEFLSNNRLAKKRISTCYCIGNIQSIFKAIAFCNLSNILLPELKIWYDISQSISLQKCITKMQKKSQKT